MKTQQGARETFVTNWQRDLAVSWGARACKIFRWDIQAKYISRWDIQAKYPGGKIIFGHNLFLTRWGAGTASWTSRSRWTRPTAPASTPLSSSPRSWSPTFSRIFIFNWFQTISDTANTFQVYLTWHLKTSTICFRCIYSDIRSYHNLIFLWFWYIHLRVNWAQQLFRPEAYVHLLSFTGLFKKSAQSDSTLILNTEVRFCLENFGLNSGEIYSDPGRNSSDTQEGNQRKRSPGREICAIKARTTRTIWSVWLLSLRISLFANVSHIW